MTDDFDLSPPELTPDDVLVVPDPYFTTENVAIVTGAASGIGRATAVALAVNGLTVVAADVDDEGLDATRETAAGFEADGDVVPVVADLTDDDAVESLVTDATDAGTLRFVANVAGMQHIASLAAFPMDAYT